MKKKISAFLLTLVLFCSFSLYCSATSKPAVEVMRTSYKINSVGGVKPKIFIRNNSGKTIKYIYWYLTPYNVVGDVARCSITNKSTVVAEQIGPIKPYETPEKPNSETTMYTFTGEKSDSPFKTYYYTGYDIIDGKLSKDVNIDRFGNLYTWSGSDSIHDDLNSDNFTYLTDEEVQNAIYDFSDGSVLDVAWYNASIVDFKINKAVVIFMDGTKTTVSGSNVYSKYFNHTLTNKPFKEQLDQYSAVYNYKEYIQYNQDLVAAFGENQKALLEHFINSGMKEGRQGSSEFNLAAYKAKNPDLVALFGDDNVKYYEHFIAGGKAEGRIAT